MNKTQLVAAVAAKAGIEKKAADKAVNAVIDSITDGLVKEGKVQLIGFGTFEVKKRKAKTARNPQTGEKVKVKASKVPTFKAGSALKEKAAKCKAVK